MILFYDSLSLSLSLDSNLTHPVMYGSVTYPERNGPTLVPQGHYFIPDFSICIHSETDLSFHLGYYDFSDLFMGEREKAEAEGENPQQTLC